MRFAHLVAVVASVVLVPSAISAERPPVKLACAKNVPSFRDAEMLFDVAGAHSVIVTFVAKRPSTADIDRALRDCLAQAIRVDGSKDIVTAPLFRAREGANPDNDEDLRPYGILSNLVYIASNKSITVHKLEPIKAGAVAKKADTVQKNDAGAMQFAARTCMKAVKERLHDPSSAQFPEPHETFVESNKTGGYLVQFEGRAKNAFGALRLGVWECRVDKSYGVSSFKQIR